MFYKYISEKKKKSDQLIGLLSEQKLMSSEVRQKNLSESYHLLMEFPVKCNGFCDGIRCTFFTRMHLFFHQQTTLPEFFKESK